MLHLSGESGRVLFAPTNDDGPRRAEGRDNLPDAVGWVVGFQTY